MFSGNLWRCLKEVKPLIVFDVEHGIAPQTMQFNRASSGGEGEVSCFFSSCCRNLMFPLELQQGWPFKRVSVQ